jgi:eukaryotic-like serine/threonine-protein kinase
MPLPAAARLGPYEITTPIGSGGMGDVYRARDTRLDRTVAIKVLPPALADDPVFRDRFEHEGRALSGLNHPNICTVHDVGTHDGVSYLVMEYLEGRTLADMLDHGAMPVGEALRIAGQIADALTAAHRQGIIHRDLKPANVMIVRAGGAAMAKLLDFGLAKRARVSGAGIGGDSVADGPTRAALTGAGIILGTFQYMSPEQVEGREADERADIWAFGCVLYEMLTGRRPFQAQTHAGLVAAILEREPSAIELPNNALAPAINRLIAACLEKNPEERFQSIRDVKRELEWISETAPTRAASRWDGRGPLTAAAAVAAAVLLLATALVVSGRGRAPQQLRATVFSVPVDSSGYVVGAAGVFGGAGSGTPAVSPSGDRIAFLAHSATDTSIWLRDLSKLAPQQLKGTSGARGLFWSADGNSIGFFANGQLKTIELATNRIEIVCDAPMAFGGTWAPDGTILFSPEERSSLYKVSAQGGTASPVTTLQAGQQAHRWPQFLPDGRHFIYVPWSDGTTKRMVTLASLDSPNSSVLFEAQSGAVLAGDYLFYVVDTPARLMAWKFDANALQLRGKPFPLVPDDNVDYQWFTAEPNVSGGGATLAYTTGKYRKVQLTWVSRTGRPIQTLGEVGVSFDPVLSADGTMLALERHDPGRGSGDIWTVDLARGAFSRLTSAPGYETTPVWGPDRRVAYASDQSVSPSLYVNSATGAGTESLLVSPPTRSFPLDWSRDGRYVVFMLNGGATRNDIWLYDLERRLSKPLVASSFNEGWARISPDGRWMAYVSDESQQREVYVRSFPEGPVKLQISTSGGGEPQWRGDGRELFYISPDNSIMSVEIRSTGGSIDPSAPQALFTANVDQNKSIRNQYAVSPDGQRFLLLSLADRAASPIVAVINWRELLTR